MPVHRIHLKGPWEYEFVAVPRSDGGVSRDASAAVSKSGRVTMPADWRSLFGSLAGRATFRRRFHKPTNLDPEERVWIAFDGLNGHANVQLNGQDLGTLSGTSSGRLDVTGALQPFNELTVELDYDDRRDGSPGGLYAPVAIEIESPDRPSEL